MKFFNKTFCKAPFVNIYIDEKGNVTPCCFNRKDIFGNIFQENIENIWHSPVAQKLRKLFYNNQFSDNCSICKKAIEAGNYYNSGLSTYSRFNIRKATIQSIDFELSYKCNLNCIMCYLHSDKYNLTSENENYILSQLNLLLKNIKRAQFYGGEPFVIPIYFKIWEKIIENNANCEILIQTNGTIINKEILNLSKKGKFIFNVSLDAVNEELLSIIRRGSKLQQIEENLQYLKMYSYKRITLAITPMMQNWKEIPKLVRYSNRNGFQVFFNNMIMPKKMALWYQKPEVLSDIIQYYESSKILTLNYVSLINKIRFKHYIKNLESLYYEALKRPNYKNYELIQYSELIYKKIIELLPQFADYSKQSFVLKIKEYLFLHNYEDIIKKIEQLSISELEKEISIILNSEQ